MTEYNAGTAKARYELDASPFYSEIERIKRAYAELRQLGSGSGVGAQTLLPGGAGAPPAARDVTPRLRDQAEAARRAQRETLALAQVEARLLAAQGNLSGAIQRINRALATQTERTKQVIAAETQRVRLQNQLDRPAGGGSTFLGGIGQAAGALGIGIGVGQLVQGGIAAGQYSIALTQTESVLKQLSGSQERYNELTRIAAQNQKLFGGSIAANYAPLTGVLALSNQTGASLQQLNSVTQLLLAKAPTKNAGDAFFGLGEFLSGNGAEAALSLADQFNLSKKAIAELAREGVSAEERLKGLTALLAEQGVTSATLAARLTDQAVAYNTLSSELDRLKANTGEGLAETFTGAATGLGRLIGLINGNPEAIAQLQALLNRQPVTQEGIDRAASQVARARAEQQLGRGAGGSDLAVATTAQRLGGDAARQDAVDRTTRLIEAGLGDQVGALNRASLASDEYFRRLRALELQAGLFASQADAVAAVGEAGRRMAGDLTLGQGSAAVLQGRMTELAGTSDANRLAIISLSNAYASNQLTGDQLTQSISALEAAQRQQEQAAQQATAAATGLSDAQRKQTLDQVDAARSSRQLAEAQATIASISQQVRAGVISAAEGVTFLATRYGYARDEALKLIDAQNQIANLEGQSKALADQRAGERGGTTAQGDRLRANALKIQQEQERAAAEARSRQLLANGSAAQIVAERQRLLNEAVRRYGEGSAQAIDAATDLEQAKTRAAQGDGKRADQTVATLDRLENRQEDYYTKLLQMQEDYQTRARRSEEDYQLGAARDREDFEQRRRKLLAEGKIAEARELEADFRRQQTRDAQDQARTRQRAAEDFNTQQRRQAADLGVDTGRIVDRAAARGVVVPGGVAVSPEAVAQAQAASQAQAILAATGGQRPVAAPAQLSIQIAPGVVQVQLDGRTIAEASLPYIERKLTEDLLVSSSAAPATTNIAGGGRP